MPKKRKVAKKKKKKQANNYYSVIHSHVEDDDLQVHDENESNGEVENREDSATVRSIVCESETMVGINCNGRFPQNVVREGEEEELEKSEDTATVQSSVSESELTVGINCNGGYTQKVAGYGEEEGTEKREHAATVLSILSESEATFGINSNGEGITVVMDESNAKLIDIELKAEGNSDLKKVNIKYVQYVEESNGGLMTLDGGSSSSSDSSDDEFRAVEKNEMVIDSGELKLDAPNLISGSIAFANSVELTGLPEVTDGVPVMEAYSLVVSKPKEEAQDPVATNVPSVNLVKPADLPEVTQFTDGVPFIEANSLVESKNASKEMIPVNTSLVVENALRSNKFKLGLKENLKNEVSGVSPVAMDMGSQPYEDKVTTAEYKNAAVFSSVMGFGIQKDENKLLVSPEVPAVNNINGADHIEVSVISECSDRQPLVASARRPVQTTSWMSCCGLFELFTGR
ncbi:uncharacterized protein LOC130760132 [Actinidia eriantha]|uniref:uncharacterized protein LOC130760132 n=1 Tax=Actinidia eriantha TaxID=165200 RepID=UPI00258B1424|nr:uncharacterized protein LOC130760132 [Actinidia eriantha]